MRPIIKWPGGKQREYKYIMELIPEYDRYIEPFFGGGAVFFMEEPRKAIINDFNDLLMDFYHLVKEQDTDFKYHLQQLSKYWGNMGVFIKTIEDELINVFYDYRHNRLQDYYLEVKVKTIFKYHTKEFIDTFDSDSVVDIDMLFNNIQESVTAKIKRMKRVECKKDTRLPEKDIYQNLETGFRSGFYTHFRELLNDCNLGRRNLPLEKHIAIFYFIREFCYGSMFRYNSRGEFNIPYGGISYNDKDFSSKINKLFSKKIEKLFSSTELHNKDFEVFLNNISFQKNDFVFF